MLLKNSGKLRLQSLDLENERIFVSVLYDDLKGRNRNIEMAADAVFESHSAA